MTGFARLHKKAVEDGALSSKVKEMMAVAVSIAVGCAGCIAYHVHDAVKAGATRPELLETIGVGLLTLAPPGSPDPRPEGPRAGGGPTLRSGASVGVGGGPGSIYAAHALDAIEQILPEPEPVMVGS